MSTPRADPAAARALAARSFIRARRKRRRPSAYQIYATVIMCAIAGALGHGMIGALVGGGVSLHGLAVFGPAVLLVALLGAARFGRWQGPVSFSPADVLLLLIAPIDVAALVRPKLEHGLLAGAALGATVGIILILVLAGGPAQIGAGRALAGVAGTAAAGLLATAISWLVQSSRRSLPALRWASPMVAGAALAIGVVGASVSPGIGVWSGPWGWAIAPVVGQPGWPAALGLLILTTAAGTAWARSRAGACSAEVFMTRAGTRSALTGAALSLDYRSAALVYRGAQPSATSWLPRIHPHPPADARWAVPWRDAIAAGRAPARCVWAGGLCAAATFEALAHPGKALPAGLAAVGMYFAAALLAEPLRMDVDAPDRRLVLVGWDFARLLLAHCVLPALVLVAVAGATVALSVLFGLAGVAALALVPTVLVPVIATAVLAAALASRRGGRIDEGLLARMLMTDPSNPAATAFMLLLLAPWLIAATLADGASIAVIGHAAARHHSLLPAGITAWLIAAAAAVVLARVAQRDR